jgi:hypothetical protein
MFALGISEGCSVSSLFGRTVFAVDGIFVLYAEADDIIGSLEGGKGSQKASHYFKNWRFLGNQIKFRKLIQ